MSHFNRVLITGAAGALGRQLRLSGCTLANHIRLSDRVASVDLTDYEEDYVLDLADFDAVLQAVEGCDAIVHLGGQPMEHSFDVVLNSNIVGSYNIYEAARRHGVKRIIYASSVHTVGFYDVNQTIDANDPPRPDTLYGVSKCFGENLSRLYFDKFGIETVCLRIGSCFPEPTDRRHLTTWLSYRDFRQLVERALSAPRVGHMISFATSANNQSFWDNKNASILGYKPEDNAEDYRQKIMSVTAQGDPSDPAIRYQGGSYCADGHFEDN